MNKSVRISIALLICLILSASEALSQPIEYLDNIRIVAIKDMHVQIKDGNTFLNTNVQIHNAGPKKLKLYDGNFRFYLQLKNNVKKLLGIDDISRDIFLDRAETLAKGKDKKETNDIEFQINMNKTQENISDSLMRILNAIGKPEEYRPVIYIEGKFRMGVESDKGWTTFPQKIEWIFRPDLRRYVLLEGGHGPNLQSKNEIVNYYTGNQDQGESGNQEQGESGNQDQGESGNQEQGESGNQEQGESGNQDQGNCPFIKFDYQSSEIREETYSDLDAWGDALKDPRLIKFVFLIQGHACGLGSKKHNMKLSLERAESVKQYLVKNHGIDPKRLQVKGFGNEKPFTTNDTPERRAVNRRVEFNCINCDNKCN